MLAIAGMQNRPDRYDGGSYLLPTGQSHSGGSKLRGLI